MHNILKVNRRKDMIKIKIRKAKSYVNIFIENQTLTADFLKKDYQTFVMS